MLKKCRPRTPHGKVLLVGCNSLRLITKKFFGVGMGKRGCWEFGSAGKKNWLGLEFCHFCGKRGGGCVLSFCDTMKAHGNKRKQTDAKSEGLTMWEWCESNRQEWCLCATLKETGGSCLMASHSFSVGVFPDERIGEFIDSFRDLILCETERYFRENAWREFPWLALDVDWEGSSITAFPMAEIDTVKEKANLRMNAEAVPGVMMKVRYFESVLRDEQPQDKLECIEPKTTKPPRKTKKADTGGAKPKRKRTVVNKNFMLKIAIYISEHLDKTDKEVTDHFGVNPKFISKNPYMRKLAKIARGGGVLPPPSDAEADPNAEVDREYKDRISTVARNTRNR